MGRTQRAGLNVDCSDTRFRDECGGEKKTGAKEVFRELEISSPGLEWVRLPER